MKPYWKKYECKRRSVLAHFVAQPSRYAQRMRGTLQEPVSEALRGMLPYLAVLGSQEYAPERARLRWETGRSLRIGKWIPVPASVKASQARWGAGKSFRMGKPAGIEVIPKFRHLQKRRVIDQLADALAEHICLGVSHNDLRPSNIIVSGRKRPKIRIIDYGRAELMTGNTLEAVDLSKDYVDVYNDVIPLLARWNPRATRRLQEYFRQRFLKRIERKF